MGVVHIVRTRTANLASVRAAFARLGAEPRWVERADDVAAAAHLVLPGVGTPAAALATLEQSALRDALAERLAGDAPTLAICLGLQLLAARSDESPGVPLFALFDAPVTRLPARVRVPQLGWNRVDSDGWLPTGYAYYANSYCLAAEHFGAARRAGFSIAESALAAHDGGDGEPARFAAAITRGRLLACQFHPELSSDFGAELLARWLAL